LKCAQPQTDGNMVVQEEDDEDEEDSFVDGVPQSPTSPNSDSSRNDSNDNIRVYVRVRPLNSKEDLAHVRDSIAVDTVLGTVHFAEPPRNFAFDGVLGESASQEDVFQLFGTNVAEACLSGYNGSIYVYGQTGSGKTYTMQGAVESVQSMHHEDKRGLMCRLLDFIFTEISRGHRKDGSVQHSCKCSYLEIYKEQITDLLEPGSSNLQIREDINRGVYVERLSEHSVWSASDAFHVVWKGLHQRHVAATQMNELSSRSHSVFTLKLEASNTSSGGVTSTKVSRLNLIDLAGSERQTFDPLHPAHESIRVKEAGAINRSLSALTNVIMSLSHRRKPLAAGHRQPFVRYRDSKLTFLLRDSLGGNSKTIIAACISPSALCFGETLSTLKFAARAKHIRCTAVMNEEYSGTVESLMLEVKSLRQQLDLLSSRGLLETEAGGANQLLSSLPSRGAFRKGSAASKEIALEALVAETLDAAGCREDLQSLHGPRRVRRLQILLAAALDRERRCELRRHKMDKYSQYLNNTLERKEQYFDALRDYFSRLVDYAAGEACYLPEFTARLVLLRQQLANATASDSRYNAEMLDGTIEAFLASEEGLVQEGMEESPSGLCYVSTQNLLEHELSTRSRSYSYGYLLGEAARRNGRRSTTHIKQLALSNSRLPGTLADSPIEESDSRVGELGQGVAGPLEQELSELRAENKLLRRQLESHPELYRLSAENRLLREHMAMLVQQKASVHQETDFYQRRQNQRQNMDGNYQDQSEKEMSLARTTSRLLSTVEDEGEKVQKVKSDMGEGKRMALKHFPGIEEVTHLSSSDSELDDEQPQGHREPDRGVPADVTSFLPAMARQVQELFRLKDGMQDELRQELRKRCQGKGSPSRFIPVHTPEVTFKGERQVEVEPHVLSEALQGATEALQHAEATLAKGGCGDLFVGTDEGGVVGDSLRRSEGMDERDVFLSLMRSLPGESQALTREGSSRQLPSHGALRSGISRESAKRRMSTPLQSSSSGGGGCLQRMKSTMQLHRIVEAPTLQEMAEASPQNTGSDDPSEQEEGDAQPHSPSENLQLTLQQVQNLSKQLESIGEMYKDVKGQLEPMQQEYLRRLDECRFLEAQCRRLDVHCKLLEERVQVAEASGTIPRNQSLPKTQSKTRAENEVSALGQSHFTHAGTGRFIPVNSVNQVTAGPTSSSLSQAPVGLLQLSAVQTGSSPCLPLQRSLSLTVLPTARSTSWAAPVTLGASARQLSQEAGSSAMRTVSVSRLNSQDIIRRVYSEPQLHLHSTVSPEQRLFRNKVEGQSQPRHGGASTIDSEVARERVPPISGFSAVSAVNVQVPMPVPAPALHPAPDVWGLQGALPFVSPVPQMARPEALPSEAWRFGGASQHKGRQNLV